ncbi:MAG TPA: Crp/Fnr family transcriptional regulator [Chryseosolibacter sp.]|nr:Crp/Fnr family transcriptional regulator [Chryseosolibacter sp.]
MINAMFEQLAKSVQQSIALSSEQLQMISHYFIPKKLRKRQYVQNAGEASKHMVFVEKGLLRSFSVDPDGHEHVMQFATEGWWIADMASFLSGEDSIYNIEALEDCELLLLTKTSMDKLIDEVPVIERYFRLLMQETIIALQRRLRVVQTHSAEETYLQFMEARPDVVARAPQQHIALYLGITPETLSRVRKQISQRK